MRVVRTFSHSEREELLREITMPPPAWGRGGRAEGVDEGADHAQDGGDEYASLHDWREGVYRGPVSGRAYSICIGEVGRPCIQ